MKISKYKMETYTKNQILTYLQNQSDLDSAINNINNFSNHLEELEKWKDIDGYEGYKISNYGNIKTFVKHQEGRYIIPLKNKGYHKVGIGSRTDHTKGKRKQIMVHKLVAKFFVPNPDNLPVVNHKDGNKLNNFYKNLEWCTYRHNNKHAFDIGIRKKLLGENNPSTNLTNDLVIKIYEMSWDDKYTQKEISHIFRVNLATVRNIKYKRTWSKITDKIASPDYTHK